MPDPGGEKTVELFFQDELPAWRITVPQPRRFKDVRHDIWFQLFTLPNGTLIGCWLRLYDIPDQPYFVHRVLDLGDEVVQQYMERLRKSKRMVLLFESTGERDEGFAQEIDIEGSQIERPLNEGLERVEKLGEVDEEAALDDFMSVFNNALKERGDVGQAWEAVLERFPLQV
jgi:hypothetical protein